MQVNLFAIIFARFFTLFSYMHLHSLIFVVTLLLLLNKPTQEYCHYISNPLVTYLQSNTGINAEPTLWLRAVWENHDDENSVYEEYFEPDEDDTHNEYNGANYAFVQYLNGSNWLSINLLKRIFIATLCPKKLFILYCALKLAC
jgi:hypothetical protein